MPVHIVVPKWQKDIARIPLHGAGLEYPVLEVSSEEIDFHNSSDQLKKLNGFAYTESVANEVSSEEIDFHLSQYALKKSVGIARTESIVNEVVSEEIDFGNAPESLRRSVGVSYLGALGVEVASEEDTSRINNPYYSTNEPLLPSTGTGTGTWGYETTASSELVGGYEAHNATDKVLSGGGSYWQCANGQNIGAWLMIDWQTAKVFNSFQFLAASGVGPKEFALEGANTLGSWTQLVYEASYPYAFVLSNRYDFNNTTAYRYYRMLFPVVGWHSAYHGIMEMYFSNLINPNPILIA